MVKDLLRKELGKTCLQPTFLYDCENVINARPLTNASNDPSELEPLTPNMLLKEIVKSGDSDLDVVDTEFLKRKRGDRL